MVYNRWRERRWSSVNLVDSFQNRLKLALKDNNITDFAVELGLSKQIISAYVNGARKPKQLMFSEIAKKLNVSEAWLMGYDVPMGRSDKATSSANTSKNHAPAITDKDLQVALFGGDGEVTDEMWEEVKRFAEFVKHKSKNNGQ